VRLPDGYIVKYFHCGTFNNRAGIAWAPWQLYHFFGRKTLDERLKNAGTTPRGVSSSISTSIPSAEELEKQRISMNLARSAERQTARNQISREDLYSRCRSHVLSRVDKAVMGVQPFYHAFKPAKARA
jgi:hypothetical protein